MFFLSCKQRRFCTSKSVSSSIFRMSGSSSLFLSSGRYCRSTGRPVSISNSKIRQRCGHRLQIMMDPPPCFRADRCSFHSISRFVPQTYLCSLQTSSILNFNGLQDLFPKASGDSSMKDMLVQRLLTMLTFIFFLC